MPKHHFIIRALRDKCKVEEFDVVAYSRSILSFFKESVYTVNNGADDAVNITESSCAVVNNDVSSENVSSASNCFSLPEKPYPSKDLVFPKTRFGSRNPCSCQHNWFDNNLWLHLALRKIL